MARRARGAGGSGSARVVLALAAITASYLTIRSGAADRLDARTTEVAARPRGRAVDRAVTIGTDLGSVYGLAGVAAALAASGRRRLAADIAASGLVAWTGAQAAKPALDRPRPYEVATADRLVPEPAGSSWPSGHIAVAAAMSTTLAPFLPRWGRVLTGAATAAVGASRLYVGVHHLTDLVAGWGVGVLSARAWRAVARRR